MRRCVDEQVLAHEPLADLQGAGRRVAGAVGGGAGDVERPGQLGLLVVGDHTVHAARSAVVLEAEAARHFPGLVARAQVEIVTQETPTGGLAGVPSRGRSNVQPRGAAAAG